MTHLPKTSSSSTDKAFVPSAAHQRDLRNAFGRFGTGVTIVTTQGSYGPVGMTANSFSSLSLDPALILWSPALSSRRYSTFADATHFCIHVLSQAQVPIARHFASQGDGFDEFDWSSSAVGAPVLQGCLAVFHCQTQVIHPAGDHALIVGAVDEVFLSTAEASALLFESGRFGTIAPLAEPQ